LTFSPSAALTLAAEAEASLDANARGDWPTPAPDIRALASMLRAAVARVEELEAETRAVRMTGADLVRMPMSDLDHHKAELLAMLTDRDSLRAKLADADRCARESLVQLDTVERQRNALLAEADSLRAKLAEATQYMESDQAEYRKLVEYQRERLREANERADHQADRASQAEAALGEMTKERDAYAREVDDVTEVDDDYAKTLTRQVAALTAERDALAKARDEACRLLEGCTNELAEHEDDPSMLDGHRTRITELRSVGKESK
jgi:chromosome segregation ATPase